MDESWYRLYGRYLAVLAARMAAGRRALAGPGDSLFLDQLRPRPRNPCPWENVVRPLPGDVVHNQPRLRPGAPPG